MKKTFNLMLTLGILLAIGLACEFTTANLSDVTFAGDKDGNKKITSAREGDEVFALSSVKNTSAKQKVRWQAFRPDGEELKIPENELVVEGARPIWFTFTVPANFSAGEYKFTVTMLNEDGTKEIDKKTGTIRIN
jgi:hypothetical protein